MEHLVTRPTQNVEPEPQFGKERAFVIQTAMSNRDPGRAVKIHALVTVLRGVFLWRRSSDATENRSGKSPRHKSEGRILEGEKEVGPVDSRRERLRPSHARSRPSELYNAEPQ